MKRNALIIIILLIIQYFLGLTTNLFVKFPDTSNQGQLWEFAWKQLPLALHILNGFLLIIGSFISIIRAKKKLLPFIGFISIFIASFAGSRFIPTQNDLYSFLMGLAFLPAIICYLVIFFSN